MGVVATGPVETVAFTIKGIPLEELLEQGQKKYRLRATETSDRLLGIVQGKHGLPFAKGGARKR